MDVLETAGWRQTSLLGLVLALVIASTVASARPALAAFPGANGKIAFASSREGDFEIFSVNPDGSGVTNVTNSDFSFREDDPAWSADGAKIAYENNHNEVWVMNADGSSQTKLTPAGIIDFAPAWSPDGTKIVFSSVGSSFANPASILVMNADGSGRTSLTAGNGPAWSPDGTTITFFARVADGTYDIFVIRPDGGGLANLTNTPGASDVSPNWSPDGSKIAYDSAGDIVVMNADGTGDTNLTAAAGTTDSDPAWSPDGLKIAFTKLVPGFQYEIAVINADGSGLTILASNTEPDTGPDWQPLAPPPASADLSLTKSDSPDPATVNEILTYTLAVANAGPNAATDVTVTDALPSGVDFVSTSASQGICTGTSTVTCALGSVASGSGATVTIVVKPTAEGTLSNAANVSSSAMDTNAANNSANASTAVGAPASTCTITGTSGNDSLVGTHDSDVICGLGGNDVIDGRGGDDTLLGGPGNDRLDGGGDADALDGEAGDDLLDGSGESDLLLGGPGVDMLDGGAHADILDGGPGGDILADTGVTGADTATYASRTTAVTVTIDGNRDDGEPGERDNVTTTIENVDGGTGGDTLVGSSFANELDGGRGSDMLRGRDGDDMLLGGPDDDSLDGEAGLDTLNGGTGADAMRGGAGLWDIVTYAARTTPVIADLDGNADDGAPGEGDRITTDTESIVGGSGNDALTGNGAANHLIGGDGHDVLDARSDPGAPAGVDDIVEGGAGDDVLRHGDGRSQLSGGDGNDFLYHDEEGGTGGDRFEGGSGIDTVSFATLERPVYAEIGEFGIESSVENLVGGAGDDVLIGDDKANLLVGETGHDSLSGGLGDDALSGGDGDDSFEAGNGSYVAPNGEVTPSQRGADAYFGGSGNDTISYLSTDSACVYVTLDGVANDGTGPAFCNASGSEGDNVHADVENVLGGRQGNRIVGSAAANILLGHGENDLIDGAGGNDRIEGADGADQLSGGAGQDDIRAGTGDDTILARDGERDDIDGGNGTDHAQLDPVVIVTKKGVASTLDRVKHVERLVP